MLVSMKDILNEARQKGYAVGAFEFWSYDSARCIVSTANKLKMPVILQIGHFERDYMDGYKNAYNITKMMEKLFPETNVALHLDHATEYSEVEAALEAGFTSVMIDASALSFEDNITLTKKVVALAKKYNASSEAELGTLAGTEGDITGLDSQTDPEQAKEFIERTEIDCLAVAIGTAHGFYTKEPEINIERLKEIAQKVSIPLVLHGGSGTPSDKIQESIKNGISKVNICTELIAAFGKRLISTQNEPNFKYNVYELFREGMLSGEQLVEEKLKLFNPKNIKF